MTADFALLAANHEVKLWPRSISTSLSESGRAQLCWSQRALSVGVSPCLLEINERQNEEIMMGAENEDGERKSTYAEDS